MPHKDPVVRKAFIRKWRYRTVYGITPEQYDMMLTAQGGKCKICGGSPRSSRLHVDHDHKTGRVRGLLCWWCNKTIVPGRMTPKLLRSAADYLDSDFDGRNV